MSRLEFEDALKICEETEKEWYDNAKLIDTMLIHDYVDNIGLSISRMTVFAQNRTVICTLTKAFRQKRTRLH